MPKAAALQRLYVFSSCLALMHSSVLLSGRVVDVEGEAIDVVVAVEEVDVTDAAVVVVSLPAGLLRQPDAKTSSNRGIN